MVGSRKAWLLVSTVVAALGVSGAARAGGGGGSSGEERGCPVTHAALTQALRAAVAAVGSNDM